MGDFAYRMVDGKYQLHEGDEAIRPPLDEIALCLDAETGTLHKHGDPALVQAWHDHSRKALMVFSSELADALVLVRGRLDLDEVNRCISCIGYAQRYYKSLHAQLALATVGTVH